MGVTRNWGLDSWLGAAQTQLTMKSHRPGPTQKSALNTQNLPRREFLAASTALALGAVVPACRTMEPQTGKHPIIDIHQHLNYSGRSDEVFLAHQRNMGITKTILLPAGREVISASTHEGVSMACRQNARATRPVTCSLKPIPRNTLSAQTKCPICRTRSRRLKNTSSSARS